MSMSPQEKREFEELKRIVRNLQSVTDVPFIAEAKRRIAVPVLGEAIIKESTGTTAGTLRSVSESGADSYSVADAYDGTITIEDALGNTYKLGYYN